MEALVAVKSLEAHLPLLNDNDKSFAGSLIASYYKWKNLSEKQMFWVEKLTARAQGFDAKPEAKVEKLASFSAVIDLFKKAKQHLKYPKITLTVGTQDVQMSVAGPNAKAPGTVNVTDGKEFGYNKFFGRVAEDGTWTTGMKVSDEELKPVRRLLQALAADPAGTAGKYGRLSGRCIFCNSKLTDKRSTAVGYGETCATNWGLHEQWKTAAALFEKETVQV